MCRIRKTIFSCNHSNKDVLEKCDRVKRLMESCKSEAERGVSPNWQFSQALCVKLPEWEDVAGQLPENCHFSKEDCGKGGPFMACIQRSQLGDVGRKVLHLCEQKLWVAVERIHRKEERLRRLESIPNGIAASVTLTAFWNRGFGLANEINWDLVRAVDSCGKLIVKWAPRETPFMDIQTLADRYAWGIDQVMWEKLPLLEDLLLQAEIEAVHGPRTEQVQETGSRVPGFGH